MKLFRVYAVTAIFILSATFAAACFLIADEKAKEISLGEGYAVVAFDSDGWENPDSIIHGLIKKIKEIIKNAAG